MHVYNRTKTEEYTTVRIAYSNKRVERRKKESDCSGEGKYWKAYCN